MKYKTLEDLKEAAKELEAIYTMIDQETDVAVKGAISEQTGGALGGTAGVGGGMTAVYFFGTVGFSGSGIVSGLAAIGALFGGGMVVGIAAVATVPLVLAGGGSWLAQSWRDRVFNEERTKLQLQAARARILIEGLLQKSLGKAIDKYREALQRLLKVIEDLSP